MTEPTPPAPDPVDLDPAEAELLAAVQAIHERTYPVISADGSVEVVANGGLRLAAVTVIQRYDVAPPRLTKALNEACREALAEAGRRSVEALQRVEGMPPGLAALLRGESPGQAPAPAAASTKGPEITASSMNGVVTAAASAAGEFSWVHLERVSDLDAVEAGVVEAVNAALSRAAGPQLGDLEARLADRIGAFDAALATLDTNLDSLIDKLDALERELD